MAMGMFGDSEECSRTEDFSCASVFNFLGWKNWYMSISKSSEWINVGFGDSAKIFDGEDFQNPIEGGSSKKLILVRQNENFALSNVNFFNSRRKSLYFTWGFGYKTCSIGFKESSTLRIYAKSIINTHWYIRNPHLLIFLVRNPHQLPNVPL